MGCAGRPWAAARLVKALEDTERSQGNFRFAATAMVGVDAVFSGGISHWFRASVRHRAGIGELVAAAFKGAPDLAAARQRLIESLAPRRGTSSGTPGGSTRKQAGVCGMDLSPAPLKDVAVSIGRLSRVLLRSRSVVRDVDCGGDDHLRGEGYQGQANRHSGLMLPVLEDSILSRRWSEGR